MAETPEIPEAEGPFQKRVAITIAIIAVILSFITNKGDNAKTDALIKSIESSERTTEASNQWAFFQAKSIKGHAYEIQTQILPMLNEGSITAEKRDKLVADFQRKVAKYEKEKTEIQHEAMAASAEAKQLKADAKVQVEVNDACDEAVLVLQIAVILCSVAILAHMPALWYIGMAVALAGSLLGTRAWFVHGEPEHQTEAAQHSPAPAATAAPAAAPGAAAGKH